MRIYALSSKWLLKVCLKTQLRAGLPPAPQRESWASWAREKPTLLFFKRALKLGDQRIQRCFGVAEQHPRVWLVEQVVLDAGESGRQRALEHNHGFGAVGFDDRHAVNRTALFFARGGIDHIIGADDQA